MKKKRSFILKEKAAPAMEHRRRRSVAIIWSERMSVSKVRNSGRQKISPKIL